MKLKEGFIVHKRDGEVMLVSAGSAGFNGVVRCNATAGFVIEQLQKETSEEALAEAMLAAFDATPAQATDAVAKVVAQLREIGALNE